MPLLLDTHVFLWFVEGHSQLSENARSRIEDTTNDLFLSMCSLWEMAIKVSLGKLVLPKPVGEFIQEQLDFSAIALLDIRPPHVFAVADLPFHHRDPFDRLLGAQCLCEGMTLVSSDEIFDRYPIDRTW